ncbi:MAG: alpha/beta hydrolase [Polyangiales bacterium]
MQNRDEHAEAALGQGLEALLVKNAIALGVRAAAGVSHLAFALRGAFAPLEVTRGFAYGDHPRHRFDLWRPRAPAAAPRPLVLFLHGGGFQHLDRGSHWAFAERFAQAGAVVMSADYRLAPAHPHPAAADDAARLLRHALSWAADFGADPAQLIVSGTSAGANLALGLAIGGAQVGRPPRACVLFSGLLQVSDIARLYRHVAMTRPLRARIASIACDYVGPHAVAHLPEHLDARLDPLLYLERTSALPPDFPAVFCSTGTRDAVRDDAERLQDCLSRHRVRSALDVEPDAGHAFQGFVHRPRVRAVWERAFAFLRSGGIPLASPER